MNQKQLKAIELKQEMILAGARARHMSQIANSPLPAKKQAYYDKLAEQSAKKYRNISKELNKLISKLKPQEVQALLALERQ